MTKTQTYRLLIGLLGLLGVGIEFYQSGPGMLLYYTVLSNILVLASFFYFVYFEYQHGSLNQNAKLIRYKGGVTLAITLTFLVYHFLLSPMVQAKDFWTLHNLLVHYLAPMGLILDTLFLDRKSGYKKKDPFLWTLLPILYCIWALVNGTSLGLAIPGAANSPFPYFFLDVTELGWKGVMTYILIISIAYLLMGYTLYSLKKLIGPKLN